WSGHLSVCRGTSPVPVRSIAPRVGRFVLLRRWIPECLMAALADILHASPDLQQESSIFAVDSAQRLRADTLQRLGKRIKALAFLLYEHGYVRGLQLGPRSLRFGPDGSRFTAGHHQQVASLDDPDGGTTRLDPLLLRFGSQLVDTLFVDDGSGRPPQHVCRRVDDGLHEILHGGVDRGVAGTSREP